MKLFLILIYSSIGQPVSQVISTQVAANNEKDDKMETPVFITFTFFEVRIEVFDLHQYVHLNSISFQ